MKAASLYCFLLLCAGVAQSQSILLQYENPYGDNTAQVGPAQIAIQLWIDFPPGTFTAGGAVNIHYDNALASLNQIDPVLEPCPPSGTDPCFQPGFDDGAGTIYQNVLQSQPGAPLEGQHHVATYIFNSLNVGLATFSVEESGEPPFGIPITFSGASVNIQPPYTCTSGSLPENFQESDPLTGLPPGWANYFVEASSDSDGDGVTDQSDNCQLVANPSQCDTDMDQIGNHCDGDFNNDCLVNFEDLGVMKQHFFAPGNLITDLNCDGITNFLDLENMKGQFFQAPGPSGLPNLCDGPVNRGGPSGWQTTTGDHCDFTGDNVGDNVTGGLRDAACLQAFGSGLEAALCTSAPLDLLGAINPVLELNANYQPAGAGGFFRVIKGTAPPSAATLPSYTVLYETDTALGAYQSLPGEKLTINLQAETATPFYACVIVTGDFDYAQVDHCIACALSCGGGPALPSRNPDCGVERR